MLSSYESKFLIPERHHAPEFCFLGSCKLHASPGHLQHPRTMRRALTTSRNDTFLPCCESRRHAMALVRQCAPVYLISLFFCSTSPTQAHIDSTMHYLPGLVKYKSRARSSNRQSSTFQATRRSQLAITAQTHFRRRQPRPDPAFRPTP